jgi:hypothetical protein
MENMAHLFEELNDGYRVTDHASSNTPYFITPVFSIHSPSFHEIDRPKTPSAAKRERESNSPKDAERLTD